MAYSYVNDLDLDEGANLLLQTGVSEQDLPAALDRYAASLNSQRAADDTSMFVKAVAVETPRLIESAARGASTWLGGVGVLEDAAKKAGSWIDPVYEEHVSKAMQGRWWTEPTGWAAQLGTLVPQLGELVALSAIPTPQSKIAAATKGASFLAKIAENLPALGAFSVQATGDIKKQLDASGVDPDVADRLAKVGGLLTGAFMEPALALKLPNVAKVQEALTKRFLSEVTVNSALKTAAKEVGYVAAGGGSMMGVAGINNAVFTQAFAEMRERDPNWKPPEGYTPQSLAEALVGGTLLTGAIRAGARVPVAMAKLPAAREAAKEAMGKKPSLITPEMADLTKPEAGLPEKANIEMGMMLRPEEHARIASLEQELTPLAKANRARSLNTPEVPLFDQSTPESVIQHYIQQYEQNGKEGPYLAGDESLRINTPVMNPVAADSLLRPRGQNVDMMLNSVILNADLKQGSPEHQALVMDSKRQALQYAGFDDKIAAMILAAPEEGNVANISGPLADKLTQTQYARYLSSLEQQAVSVYKSMNAQKAADAWKPQLISGLAGSHFIDPATGRDLPLTPLRDITKTPLHLFMANAFADVEHMFRSFSNATGINAIGLFDGLRQIAMRVSQHTETISNELQSLKFSLPKWMRVGRQQHDVHKILSYFLRNGVDKDISERQWFKGDDVQYLKRANEIMKTKGYALTESVNTITVALMEKAYDGARTPEAQRNHAKDLSALYDQPRTRFRSIMDYGYKLTGLDHSKYLDDYLPRMWSDLVDKKKKWGDVLREKQAEIDAMEDAAKRAKEQKDWNAFVSLYDTNYKERLRSPGVDQGTAFYEHRRMSDEQAVKFAAQAITEDDPFLLIHNYMHRAISKYHYGDFEPLFAVFAKDVASDMRRNMTSEMGGGLKTAEIWEQAIESVYDATMGHDAAQMHMAAKRKVMSNVGVMGRMLNKGWEVIEKRIGHKVDLTEKPTIRESLQAAINAGLITSCGVPFNMTMPLQNYIQQSVQAAMFGIRDNLRGKLLSVTHRAEVEKFVKFHGLIVREHPFGIEPFKVTDRPFSDMTNAALGLMEGLDVQNRHEAAAMGMIKWREIEAAEKRLKRPLSREELSRYIFRTTSVDEAMQQMSRKVWEDHKKSLLEMGFTEKEVKDYVGNEPRGHRAVAQVTYDLYKQGKTDAAKRFSIQHMIDASNFIYSNPGRPTILKTSMLGRAFATFITYPSNYVSFMAQMWNPRNANVTGLLRFWGSSLALMGLFTAMGVSSSQWLGFGPLPSEVRVMGPFARMFNSIVRILSGGGKAVQAKIAGTEEDQRKAMNIVQKELAF